MDVRDGFIVGIYNYCDSWCETCAFTSRCRVFADVAEAQAALDPQLKALVEAPPLPEENPPPPGWMKALIDEMNEASAAPHPRELDQPRRTPVPVAHLALRERSRVYCEQVHAWLKARDFFAIDNPRDPRAVVGWFHTLIPAKIGRAVIGLAEDATGARDWPADYDGSAKVALLGLEQAFPEARAFVRPGFDEPEDVARLLDDG